jgi:hypothetical protein
VTSQINFQSINQNFPVPGQDNDTQVFRDNFDTIKNSLAAAKKEIDELQLEVARLEDINPDTGATTPATNDFKLSTIENAIVSTIREEKWDYGDITLNEIEVSFNQGHYQILKVVGTNVNLVFKDFPGDPELPGTTGLNGVGRIRLEIYADETIRTINFEQPFGTAVKRSGFPSAFFTHSSSTNPVIIEVWRYNSSTDNIYVRYMGIFE